MRDRKGAKLMKLHFLFYALYFLISFFPLYIRPGHPWTEILMWIAYIPLGIGGYLHYQYEKEKNEGSKKKLQAVLMVVILAIITFIVFQLIV